MKPRLSAVDLNREMRTTGVDIHGSAVKRRLYKIGWRAYRPMKTQLLTTIMCKKHLQWTKTYKSYTEKQ